MGVVIFGFHIKHCLKDTSRTEYQNCWDATELGTKLNGLAFAILSFLLVATVIPLFTSLLALQKAGLELTQGVKMLSAVFAIFTICYVTRTLYDLFISPNLTFAHLFSGVTLPLLWDFTPIFLMFTYHYLNLRILNEQEKNRDSSRGPNT